MNSLLFGALHLSAKGHLSVDEAWARYTQPGWWPRWAPHLKTIDYPEPVIRPDTSGRVRGIGGVTADFHIDAVDEAARTWAWSVRSGPLRLRFDHGVDAAPPGSEHVSRAWLVIHALWPVALGYAPMARYSLGRLVAPDL